MTGKRASNVLATVVVHGVFLVATIALYIGILALIGAAISWAALSLGETIRTGLETAPKHGWNEAVYRPLFTPGALGSGAFTAGVIFMSQALVWLSMPPSFDNGATFLRTETRTKLTGHLDEWAEWLVKLAEIVLVAVVFQLGAQKTHLWPVQVLAYLIFFCLVWHTMKPISRVIIRPLLAASSSNPVISAFATLVSFTLALAIMFPVVASLGAALQALLTAGIAGASP